MEDSVVVGSSRGPGDSDNCFGADAQLGAKKGGDSDPGNPNEKRTEPRSGDSIAVASSGSPGDSDNASMLPMHE